MRTANIIPDIRFKTIEVNYFLYYDMTRGFLQLRAGNHRQCL